MASARTLETWILIDSFWIQGDQKWWPFWSILFSKLAFLDTFFISFIWSPAHLFCFVATMKTYVYHKTFQPILAHKYIQMASYKSHGRILANKYRIHNRCQSNRFHIHRWPALCSCLGLVHILDSRWDHDKSCAHLTNQEDTLHFHVCHRCSDQNSVKLTE